MNDEKGYSQALLGVDGEWRGMGDRTVLRETAGFENGEDLDPVAESEGNKNVSKALDDD